MFSSELRIPRERIAVLIGVKGSTKKQIEETLEIKLDIDSEEGFVLIKGEDALNIYTATDVVKAIGRGFNPDVALLLVKTDYMLETMDISSYAKSKKSAIRLKGRVIGEEGKSRRTIEQLTETFITVFGKTISIIGRVESAVNAKKAIEKLLQGSPHSKVFTWLEKKRREMRIKELEEGKVF